MGLEPARRCLPTRRGWWAQRATGPKPAGRGQVGNSEEESFLLLASGGLLLLIVLAEPWLLALAVQVGVVLGGLYLLVRFVKAAWRD
jgi:hypothetical protein